MAFTFCRCSNDACFYRRISTGSSETASFYAQTHLSENGFSYVKSTKHFLKQMHLFFQPNIFCLTQQKTTTLIRLYLVCILVFFGGGKKTWKHPDFFCFVLMNFAYVNVLTVAVLSLCLCCLMMTSVIHIFIPFTHISHPFLYLRLKWHPCRPNASCIHWELQT